MVTAAAAAPGAASADDPPQEKVKAAIHTIALTMPGDLKVEGQRHGCLTRELYRQAVLIAARDELGLSTRDAVLGEWDDRAEIDGVLPLSIATGDNGLELAATVTDGRDANTVKVWEQFLPIRYQVEYEDLADKLELLSRTAFAKRLSALCNSTLGLTGKANPVAQEGAVTSEVEQQLGEMNFIAQFAAIRTLHEELRSSGESPERLAALARGYANLGLLTNFYFRPICKTFFARSLLYAQRLAAKYPKLSLGKWHRAYALALLGRHVTALEELKAAAAMDAAMEKAANVKPPPWALHIEAFCKFDEDQLVREPPDEYQQLVRMLRLIPIEVVGGDQQIIDAVEQMRQKCPDCYRAIDVLAAVPSLGTKGGAAALAMESASASLYGRIEKLPNLLAQANEIAAAWQPGGEKELANRARLIQALRAGGEDAQAGRGEPGWRVLALMLEDSSFIHAWRAIDYRSEWLSVDVDDELEELLPLFEGHVYQQFLQLYSSDPDKVAATIKALPEAVAKAELGMAAIFMAAQVKRLQPNEEDDKVLSRVFRDQDRTYSDFVPDVLFRRIIDYLNRAVVDNLREVSPHMPATIMHALRYDWESVQDRIPQIEQAPDRNPVLGRALAKAYIQRHNLAAAERCLEKLYLAQPNADDYFLLAGLYRRHKRFDPWKKALDKFLEVEVPGLEHASAQNDLAVALMLEGEFLQALPHAESAAGSGAEWAMRTAALCQTALAQYDKAEEYVQAISNRYGTIDWHKWCVYTGKGDGKAAQQHAAALLDSPRGRQGTLDYEAANVLLLKNDTPAAYEAIQAIFEKRQQPFAGVHGAALALEQRKEDDARQLLQAVELLQHNDSLSASSRMFTVMARQMTEILSGNESPTRKDLDAYLYTEDGTVCAYLWGRFLYHAGHKEVGRDYLRMAAAHPFPFNAGLLARQHLVQLGDDPQAKPPALTRSRVPEELREAVLAVSAAGGMIEVSLIDGGRTRQVQSGLIPLEPFDVTLVSLDGKSISEEQMAQIGLLNSVVTLQLDGSKVSDDSLRHLAGLKKLQRLVLNDNRITDNGLRHLRELSSLRMLALGKTQVRGAGLAHLANHPALTELWLTDAPLQDEGLKFIGTMSNLQELHLDKPAVTDAGLKNLASLKRLARLRLNFLPEVTGEGLRAFRELPRIQDVLLACPRVTDAGIANLQGAKIDVLGLEAPKLPMRPWSIWPRSTG